MFFFSFCTHSLLKGTRTKNETKRKFHEQLMVYCSVINTDDTILFQVVQYISKSFNTRKRTIFYTRHVTNTRNGFTKRTTLPISIAPKQSILLHNTNNEKWNKKEISWTTDGILRSNTYRRQNIFQVVQYISKSFNTINIIAQSFNLTYRHSILLCNLKYHQHQQCSAQGEVLHCKLRHQGCNSAQTQVFHCKLRNLGCSFTRDE